MGRRRSKKLKNELPIPTTASSSSPPSPPWIELPEAVTANILQRLGAEEILLSAQKVCTKWWKVSKHPAMWRVVNMRNEAFDHYNYKLIQMCRCAVDRSQGQLIDLTITRFGGNDLIKYVADRSSNLRRLTLSNPHHITGWKLAESVKKLSQLEELHLIYMSAVSAEDIEAIGISSPMLKSFTFSDCWSDFARPCDSDDDDDIGGHASRANQYAFAIGKTMPNLHHLRLFSIHMYNDGLEAILDGCPHLESLDLRLCFHLGLDGDLGKRCREKIKDLRLPSDSTTDLEWHPMPSRFSRSHKSSNRYDDLYRDYYSL